MKRKGFSELYTPVSDRSSEVTRDRENARRIGSKNYVHVERPEEEDGKRIKIEDKKREKRR